MSNDYANEHLESDGRSNKGYVKLTKVDINELKSSIISTCI